MQNGSERSDLNNPVLCVLTGEPVVTQTQNEFEHYIYSITMPASQGLSNSRWRLPLFPGIPDAKLHNRFLTAIPVHCCVYAQTMKIVDFCSRTASKYWVVL